MYRFLFVLAATASASVAASLSDHTNFTTYDLDSVSEASAVTYSRDTDTLYSIGDEGAALVQISKTGAFIDQMTFDNSGPREGRTLDDPEGLSYANGNIYISDERRNVAWKTPYAAGTQVGKGVMPSYVFGAPEGNTGLEGVSYDPIDGSLWGVKESSTAAIYKMTNPEGSPSVSEPVEMRFLNRLDLSQYSDIYVMANSAAFSLTDPRRLNLLLLSRNANLLVEITRSGQIVDTLDISGFGRGTIEGLTMDDAGNIYLVSEGTPNSPDPSLRDSALHVLSAVPEPSTVALMAMGVAGGLLVFSRRARC